MLRGSAKGSKRGLRSDALSALNDIHEHSDEHSDDGDDDDEEEELVPYEDPDELDSRAAAATAAAATTTTTTAAAATTAGTEVPEGWTKETDPASGHAYYYNHEKRKSVWDISEAQ